MTQAALATTTPAMPTAVRRALLVGCGRAGSRFFRAVRHLERADGSIQAVGLCDTDLTRPAMLEPGLPAFIDAIDAVRAVDPDLVFVCVNERDHHRVLRALLDNPRPIPWLLCEKPLTETVAEAEDVAARLGPTALSVNFCERFSRTIADFRAWTAPRAIRHIRAEFFWGKSRVFDPRPTMGVLSEITHPLDLLRFLIGLPTTTDFTVSSVSAGWGDYSVHAQPKMESIDVRGLLGGTLPIVGHASFVWSRRDRRLELFLVDDTAGELYQATFTFDDPVWDCDRLCIERIASDDGRRQIVLMKVYDRSDLPLDAHGLAKVVAFIRSTAEIPDSRYPFVSVHDALWVQRTLDDLGARASQAAAGPSAFRRFAMPTERDCTTTVSPGHGGNRVRLCDVQGDFDRDGFALLASVASYDGLAPGEVAAHLAVSEELRGAVSSVVHYLDRGQTPTVLATDKVDGQLVRALGTLDSDACVMVWAPLSSSTLRVRRGSHHWGVLERHEAVRPGVADLSAFASVDVPVGSAVVFHPNLVAALPNTPPASVLLAYRCAEEPVRDSARSNELGGGRSDLLERGERAAYIEKRHLIVGRVMRGRAQAERCELIDVGTDYHYPFYEEYTPTRAAQDALARSSSLLLHYPSSFGIEDLRAEVARFAKRLFGIELDEVKQVMINTGASQAFDALSRSLAGRWVLLPDLSLPTVASIAIGNGAELLRIPLDGISRLMDLTILERVLKNLSRRGETVRFVYFNSPCNPNGASASTDYLAELVAVARRHGTLVVHDMDAWYTTHTSARLANVLEVPGSMECAVTILSISKEFGLPGARVGFIVGNDVVIDTVRAHNSLFCVMIPEVTQRAALAALAAFNPDKEKPQIRERITQLLQMSIDGWRSLGWPTSAILEPQAGFKYLFEAPPRVSPRRGLSGAELFDYFVASRAYVKLSTSMSFNPDNKRYMRMVVMQDEPKLVQLFERLDRVGVRYNMSLSDAIADEYHEMIATHVTGDF